MRQQPKIDFYYDIETAPGLGLWFGKPYEVNISKTIQHEYVLGFAYAWDDGPIKTCYIWDFPEYHKKIRPKNDTLAAYLEAHGERINVACRQVIAEWGRLVTEAYNVAGHNSDRFDYRQMMGRIAQYGLPPVPWPQFIDTKKMAKQIGDYPSNKLDDLGERFSIGKKLPHKGYTNPIELWWDCMNGVKKAEKHMVHYNKIDVDRTRKLRKKLQPYARTGPNMAVIVDRPMACRSCGSEDTMIVSKRKPTASGLKIQYQCKNPRCGAYYTPPVKALKAIGVVA